MAAGLGQLADHLTSVTLGAFQPRPYYEPKTDSLIFYVRDVRSYGQRINKYFTVFLAVSDDSLVGFEVKGIKSTLMPAIEGLGDVNLVDSMPMKAPDGEPFDLEIIMRCALVPKHDVKVEGEQYAQLDNMAKGVKVRKGDLCGA